MRGVLLLHRLNYPVWEGDQSRLWCKRGGGETITRIIIITQEAI